MAQGCPRLFTTKIINQMYPGSLIHTSISCPPSSRRQFVWMSLELWLGMKITRNYFLWHYYFHVFLPFCPALLCYLSLIIYQSYIWCFRIPQLPRCQYSVEKNNSRSRIKAGRLQASVRTFLKEKEAWASIWGVWYMCRYISEKNVLSELVDYFIRRQYQDWKSKRGNNKKVQSRPISRRKEISTFKVTQY